MLFAQDLAKALKECDAKTNHWEAKWQVCMWIYACLCAYQICVCVCIYIYIYIYSIRVPRLSRSVMPRQITGRLSGRYVCGYRRVYVGIYVLTIYIYIYSIRVGRDIHTFWGLIIEYDRTQTHTYVYIYIYTYIHTCMHRS